jgi:hypothetical protein
LDRTLPLGCQPISHKAQQNVLMNPNTAAALFELSNPLAFTEGAGFDRCQVAVITNIDPTEDLSTWFFNDEYKLVLAKRLASDVVLPTGYTVLNAADPLMTSAAEKTKGNVIYFARSEETPTLAAHRQRTIVRRQYLVRHRFACWLQLAARSRRCNRLGCHSVGACRGMGLGSVQCRYGCGNCQLSPPRRGKNSGDARSTFPRWFTDFGTLVKH